MPRDDAAREPAQGTPMSFKAVCLIVICLALGGSVAGRVLTKDDATEATSPPPRSTSGVDDLTGNLQPTDAPPAAAPKAKKEAEGFEKALPVVSEASFFAFIGFALGYATRKVVKLAMIFVAILFMTLQGLSYLEVVQIDWGRALELVNGFILNLKENQSVGEILKDRIPTAGALMGGYFLGFRKG